MRALNLTFLAALGVALGAAAERPPSREEREKAEEEQMEDGQAAALSEMRRAVNAGDAGSYARLYAERAVITIHGGSVLQGRAAIEQYEVDLLREFPGTQLRFYDAWLKEREAVVHYGVNGRTAAGHAMGHEGLLFYRFAPSGLILEERRYLDSLTPMAQLGLLGLRPAREMPKIPVGMMRHDAEESPEDKKNVAVVRATLAALDAKKEAAFLASLADDAVIEEMVEPRTFRGTAEAKAWFAMWTAAIPDATTEITRILGTGGVVLLEATVRGTLKGPLGYLSATDKKFAVHRAAIVELEGGKIMRLSAFMNSKEIAQATGQWPLPAEPVEK